MEHKRVFDEYTGSLLFEPPKKIGKSIYECSNKFYLDPILEMFGEGESTGIVLMSGKEVQMHKVTVTGSHKETKLLYSKQVSLQGSTRRGGQSAVRISRLAKEKKHNYVSKVAEAMVAVLMKDNNTRCIISQMILAGPANTKMDLFNKEIVQQYFGKMIRKIVNTDVITHETVWQVFNQLDDTQMEKEREVEHEVDSLLATDCDLLVFGYSEVEKMIKECMLKKVVVINNHEKFVEINEGKTYDCEVIHCRSVLLGYSIIGIRWYS